MGDPVDELELPDGWPGGVESEQRDDPVNVHEKQRFFARH
jgi:hypothetical protein